MKSRLPDYGTDGDPTAMLLSLIAFVIVDAILFLIHSQVFKVLACLVLASGMAFLSFVFWHVLYIKFGKLRHRDAILSLVEWKGNETVLDVGTGRGLLLIGAAKMLGKGKAIGIDIWRRQDMAGNGPEGVLLNAKLEGVSDKIEVREEDIRKTSFPPDFFDVVLSNLCLHNIPSIEGREAACREIARVMKPSGVAIISDGFHTNDYLAAFTKEGMEGKIIKGKFLSKSFWLHTVVAVKNVR